MIKLECSEVLTLDRMRKLDEMVCFYDAFSGILELE